MNSQNTLTHRTFSGMLHLVSAGGIQVIVKIAVLAVLARIILPNEFGLVGIAIVIVEFSKLFSHMGIGPFIVQRKDLQERHLTTGFSFSILLGTFFAILIIISAPLLQSFFQVPGLTDALRVIALIFLFDSFTVIGLALLQRSMKFKVIAIIEVSSYMLGYGAVGIVLAFLNFGIWALVIASISQAILQTLMILFVQPFPKKINLERKALNEMFYYGGGFTIARIANFLANQIDSLVIARMLGVGALGIYGRAHQFMVMPSSLVGNALDRTLFPAMAKIQDDKLKLARIFITGTSLISLIAIPLSILFIFLAPEIVVTLLGKNWIDVILPFQILAGSLLFRTSYKMSDSLARSTAAVYKRAWRQVIYAIAVFVGAYLGHFGGLPGVAIGISLSITLNFFMMSHLSMQLTGIKSGDLLKAHKHGLMLGLLTGFCSYLLVTLFRQWNLPPVITLIGTVTGAGITIFLGLRFYPRFFIRNDHRELFNKLVSKKFKKYIPQAA